MAIPPQVPINPRQMPSRPLSPRTTPSGPISPRINPSERFSKPSPYSRPTPYAKPGSFGQDSSQRFSKPPAPGQISPYSRPGPYARPSMPGVGSSQRFSKAPVPARVSPYSKPAPSSIIAPKPLYPARLQYKKLMSAQAYRKFIKRKAMSKWSREFRNLKLTPAEKMEMEKELGGLFKGKYVEQRYLDKKVLGKRGYFAKKAKKVLYGPWQRRTRRSRAKDRYTRRVAESLVPRPATPQVRFRRPAPSKSSGYGASAPSRYGKTAPNRYGASAPSRYGRYGR